MPASGGQEPGPRRMESGISVVVTRGLLIAHNRGLLVASGGRASLFKALPTTHEVDSILPVTAASPSLSCRPIRGVQ